MHALSNFCCLSRVPQRDLRGAARGGGGRAGGEEHIRIPPAAVKTSQSLLFSMKSPWQEDGPTKGKDPCCSLISLRKSLLLTARRKRTRWLRWPFWTSGRGLLCSPQAGREGASGRHCGGRWAGRASC